MLTIKDLSFSYPNTNFALHYPSLSLADGELIAVMGPSGCGKSTLLNLIAGFMKPTGGELKSDFQKIAYVFQEPRLFPWLTVEQNLRAVLPKETTDHDIHDTLSFVGLPETKNMFPTELSGGMKSRVSLARALAFGGDLYLFDEPMAALDEELRKDLARGLRNKLREVGASAILVTHDRETALIFADRIVELDDPH